MCLVLKHGYVSFFVSFTPMGVGRIILSPSAQDQPERKLLETPGITLPYFFNLPFPNHFFCVPSV